MSAARWHGSIAAAGALVAALLPLSPALATRDVVQARVLAAVLAAVVCAAIALSTRVRALTWTVVAIAAAVAGVAALVAQSDAATRCVAPFDRRMVVIGRDYTAAGGEYVRKHPGSSPSDLLLDAGGAADRIWTESSIASCRMWLTWGGLLAVPLFAACVSALAARRTHRFTVPAVPASPVRRGKTAGAPVYDAFLSYRHTDPDRAYAGELLEQLESRGLRVAIDFRDFTPNEHFLSEMERCIAQSRFVLCVVTARYVDSDHCSEEAILSKTIDMAERTRRLVPLFYERVPLPVWLHGLVGVDCTSAAALDPVERVVALLGR